MNDTATVDSPVLPRQKQWFMLKSNGVANIRSINACLKVAPEQPNFWLPGIMVPRKVRKTTSMKKSFFYYDYIFLELADARTFEKFLSDRHIPAYFVHKIGSKDPLPLEDAEILAIRQLETIKQLEVEAFKTPLVKPGSYI